MIFVHQCLVELYDYTHKMISYRIRLYYTGMELDYTYKYDVTEWAHNDTGYGVYLK